MVLQSFAEALRVGNAPTNLKRPQVIHEGAGTILKSYGTPVSRQATDADVVRGGNPCVVLWRKYRGAQVFGTGSAAWISRVGGSGGDGSALSSSSSR